MEFRIIDLETLKLIDHRRYGNARVLEVHVKVNDGYIDCLVRVDKGEASDEKG